MTAATKSYKLICFQLRNKVNAQLKNPLKKEVNRLTDSIIKLINSEEDIHTRSSSLFSEIFNLRMKAFKWLLADSNHNFLDLQEDIFSEIENLKINPKLEVLAENLLFALRCNQRVINALLETAPTVNTLDLSVAFPELTYEQLLSALKFGIPDSSMTQKTIEWINCSLQIEFGLLAAAIISENNLTVSDKTINDLAFVVAGAAQNHYALASELGLLKSRFPRQSLVISSFDDEFIKEEKQFADTGISDFASTFI